MSYHHKRLDRRKWQRVRRQALNRAGYRSEQSGQPGRLEVDHIIPLERGGDPYSLDNVQVLTRSEHIEKTRRENRKPPTPTQRKWKRLVNELA